MGNPAIFRLPLFRGVNRARLAPALANARIVNVARGELVIRQGERVPALHAVLDGTLKARLRHAHGDELVLGLLSAGDTFGEAPALLRRPAKVDVVAITGAELALIDPEVVLHLLHDDARFARNLAMALAGQVNELLAHVHSGMHRSAQRLASYLDSLAQPAPTPGQWTARLPVSKTLVAAQLGVKKETLSRLLKQLATRGVISVTRRDITILDRDGLARLTLP